MKMFLVAGTQLYVNFFSSWSVHGNLDGHIVSWALSLLLCVIPLCIHVNGEMKISHSFVHIITDIIRIV